MSNTRYGRGFLQRSSGDSVRFRAPNPSEGAIPPPVMPIIINSTRPPINPNNGVTQQRPTTQSNSGVVRYFISIQN